MTDEKWLEKYNSILKEGSSYYRSPKSKQEKTMASGSDVDEEEPKVRAKRNSKNLPDSWDDKNPSRTRNWKKHRKTQYKVKEGLSRGEMLWLKKFSGTLTEEDLSEGISFMVAKYDEEKGWLDGSPSKYVEEDCWVCKGSGEDRSGRDCYYCDGRGKTEEPHYDHPPLSVSNANAAYIIRDLLGMEFDYSGSISPEKIPEIKRRLIKIKNDSKARAAGEREVSSVGGERIRYKDDSGMDRIGRSAQLIDMGRSSDQVTRYIDDLIELLDYAQKNNMHVCWD